MNLFRIHPFNPLEALEYAKRNKLPGFYYPNQADGDFLELTMSDEDMVAMRLTVPCQEVEKL